MRCGRGNLGKRGAAVVADRLNAGVDWLTMTCELENPSMQELRRRGIEALSQVESEGYQQQERHMLGYTGVSCGNCFVGVRDDGLMVQMTGHHADVHFEYLYMSDVRFSRLDVQVTRTYPIMPADVANVAYHEGIKAAEMSGGQFKRKLLLMTGSDGADTCYVGSPTSEQRGRIYNKDKQSMSEEYKNCWRWEVTFKNELAKAAAGEIKLSNKPYTVICRDIVGTWFEDRGTAPEWASLITVTPIRAERMLPTDVERKLRWLEKQVKPTIQYLQSMGFESMIMASLGLTHPE
jgi:DNA relaxase NicK